MINSIEFTNKGVKVILSKIITSKDIDDARTEIYQYDGFENLENQLWIFDPVEDIVVSTQEIKDIAERNIKMSQRNPKLKSAVVSKSSLVFGLARVREVFYSEGP